MGRLDKPVSPPASGAIIFYRGRYRPGSGTSTFPAGSTTTTVTGTSNASSVTSGHSNPQLLSSDRKSGSDEFDDKTNHLPFATNFVLSNPSDVQPSFNPSSALGKRGSATGQVILSLAKDILDVFAEVPYVKIVVGLVQQIISISEELQSNKERGEELVGKVLTYARVVFEALLGMRGQHSQALSGIKEDLLAIGSVLQSSFETLQHLTTSKAMSHLNRLLHRDDIASKLLEQDRRLDTTITAFQLKSSIVLRSKIDKTNDKESSELLTTTMAHTHSRKWTRGGLRAKPQVIFGRNQEINAVVEFLLEQPDNRPSRICILGSGGIGKTTLALSIIHHELIDKKFDTKRFFVPCEAAPAADLLLEELATSLEIIVEEVKDHIFKAILRRLQQSPCLLVLDNFETPWDPPQYRSEIESLLAEISSLPTVTLIVTMRGSQQPVGTLWSQILPPLQPIDIESAASIFEVIAHKVNKHAIDLIRAVDCVPLAVTLLANLAAVDGETTEALWSRWEEESTSMIENGQDRLSSLEASVQLSLSSPRMKRDPGAMLFLSTISLLPDGISTDTLKACEMNFPDKIPVKKAISTLKQNALVFEDANGDLRILSPIRLFVLARHPPSPRSRAFIYNSFIELALQGTSYHEPSVRLRLQREANNISGILADALASSTEQSLPGLVEAIISFCHYSYVSGKGSTQAVSRAVEKLEAMKISSTISIIPPVASLTTGNKSVWLKAFGGLAKSQYKKATDLPAFFANQASPNAADTLKLRADCMGCWGQVLGRQSQFSLAREKFELAKELHITVGDIAGQAYDLLNIGLLLSRERETLTEALETFQKTAQIHEKLNDKAGKAYVLLGAGHVYRDLSRFIQAKEMFDNALEIFAELDDDMGQTSVLNALGMTMLSLSRYSEAAKYFTEAVRLTGNTGNIIGNAENVAGLAITFLLRSRFLEAQTAIEKAMALRDPIVDPDHLHILGRICIAMRNYKQAEIHLNRSLACYEEIGDSRGQADNLLSLGYIRFYCGDYIEAQDLAKRAAVKAGDNEFMIAETAILEAQTMIRNIEFRDAGSKLWYALKVFESTECTLGQAHCLYVHAVLNLRLAQFDKAMEKLNKAFELHAKVESIQGQADDLNLICETLMLQGAIDKPMKLISEALALHIQIDDESGQGDDLYIQSSLFLAQGRLVDAESTMRKAIDLHKASQSAYGIARDFASLSNIIWQQQ